MTQHVLIIALSAIIASYGQPSGEPATGSAAPPGTTTTRYCMHVGPVTGNLAETIECWTRDEWAEQGVDVDKDWAKDGVRTID